MGSHLCKEQGKQLKAIRPLASVDPLRQPHQLDQKSTMSQVKPTEWPLPPTHSNEEFQLEWPPNSDRYSLEQAYNRKCTQSNKRRKSAATNPEEHREFHQKETGSGHWKKTNTSIHQSAHVQSSLETQSHSCINLSTKEEVDRLLLRLNKIYSQTDRNVEQEQKILSLEAKEIVGTIVNDTRAVQQNLLAFAKRRQTEQDELYNEWLQRYVVRLDTWRSTCLAELQEELQKYQKTIMSYSQKKIAQVNADSNQLRDDIFKREQINTATSVQEITDKIQSMSTHHLGTETVTKINLIIHGNVGTKAPGQGCTFDFTHNHDDDDPKSIRKTAVPPKSHSNSTV